MLGSGLWNDGGVTAQVATVVIIQAGDSGLGSVVAWAASIASSLFAMVIFRVIELREPRLAPPDGHKARNLRHRTPVRRNMVRPPEFQYPESDSTAVAKAKQVFKELSPDARASVMAWLVKYFNDSGGMFSPQITQERRKVTIDSTAFWLVRIPKK